jgi:hypothetical protein
VTTSTTLRLRGWPEAEVDGEGGIVTVALEVDGVAAGRAS